MFKYFFGLITLLETIKQLVSLCFVIFRWVRDNYVHYEDRKEVVKEVKEAVKESLATGSTTRLANLTDPNSPPFPRKDPS